MVPTTHLDGTLREEVVSTPTIIDDVERGKGKRIRYPSTKLRGFVTNTIQKVSLSSSLSSASIQTSGMSYPITHFVNYDRFSMGHRNFLASISVDKEPRSFKEAMKNSGWQAAMQKRFQH